MLQKSKKKIECDSFSDDDDDNRKCFDTGNIQLGKDRKKLILEPSYKYTLKSFCSTSSQKFTVFVTFFFRAHSQSSKFMCGNLLCTCL